MKCPDCGYEMKEAFEDNGEVHIFFMLCPCCGHGESIDENGNVCIENTSDPGTLYA